MVKTCKKQCCPQFKWLLLTACARGVPETEVGRGSDVEGFWETTRPLGDERTFFFFSCQHCLLCSVLIPRCHRHEVLPLPSREGLVRDIHAYPLLALNRGRLAIFARHGRDLVFAVDQTKTLPHLQVATPTRVAGKGKGIGKVSLPTPSGRGSCKSRGLQCCICILSRSGPRCQSAPERWTARREERT